MKVTYIKHSGFMIEWEHCIWIFDYWNGTMPSLRKDKKIFVFGSHSHADHFNPDIVKLLPDDSQVTFILADDIRFRDSHPIIRLAPEEFHEEDDGFGKGILIRTLTSTDCGVAFLITYQGRHIYHAGDLNCWIWKGEEEEINQVMTEQYQRQIDLLKVITPVVDVAFIPLDPRQEELYDKGMEEFAKRIKVKKIFPMHFWNEYQVIKQLKESVQAADYARQVMEIQKPGQVFEVE